MSERDNLAAAGGRRGRYEVWFLTISDPDRRAGYWVRYTVRYPVAGPPEPRLWFASFSRQVGETFGLNRPLLPADLRIPSDRFEVRMGGALFGSGAASGEIEGAGHRVRWDLRFQTDLPTLGLLPEALYRGAVAPTKPYVPNPHTTFTGEIEVDGAVRELRDLPGQQGHVVGTRHAERWAWAACTAFDGDGAAFHAISAQTRRGPFLTPFLTFAALRVHGRWVRLRGMDARRDWGLGWWRVSVGNRRHRLEGDVRAAPEAMLRTRYLDPDDTPRWCHNSEVASCRLTLSERGPAGWQEVAELASDGTTHAEWAGRTPASAVQAVHAEVP